jgi:hypothetical protein|nr:MAG TPA: hypothetical protein [Caudoviricetes sp.]
MIIKTFVIGMVLVGITIILTELHRYMVYSEELERELELERAYDPIALERLLKVDDDAR